MFINLTNHPSQKWGEEQLKAASEYGSIYDLPFPEIDPYSDEEDLQKLCEKYIEIIKEFANLKEESETVTIHIMGEVTFTFILTDALIKRGFNCIASTSRRNVIELSDGKKEVEFQFTRFRRYTYY